MRVISRDEGRDRQRAPPPQNQNVSIPGGGTKCAKSPARGGMPVGMGARIFPDRRTKIMFSRGLVNEFDYFLVF